ncbi:MAG TPA: hypothetical protein IAA19_04330 [Candidatus Olsenella pullistercoris]|uniref:Uncharacterized protein n=1 Tax=Candidatus Olsenella pullistercoris TaxID=2838712 RepID=A0A9D2EYB0_9ACTN|nr:hypothetical protein [Candidatus Olsenella pullistercoris]
MDLPVAVVSGALFGLLGCVAPAALFERALRGDAPVSLAAGVAAVGASFLSLSAVLVVVRLVTTEGFLEFGCSMGLSLIAFWSVEAARAWRAANSGTRG